MFALIAAFIFILAAFGVTMGEVNLVALGLCLLSIQLIATHGVWPFGPWSIKRRN